VGPPNLKLPSWNSEVLYLMYLVSLAFLQESKVFLGKLSILNVMHVPASVTHHNLFHCRLYSYCKVRVPVSYVLLFVPTYFLGLRNSCSYVPRICE